MRRILGALVVLVTAGVGLSAASYRAFEQITVANTAIGFTALKINYYGTQATVAQCRLETAEVRYTLDGTTPTSSVGTLLEIGDVLTITDPTLIPLFKAIRTGSTSGQLDCLYTAP